jgi:hypothetical protein
MGDGFVVLQTAQVLFFHWQDALGAVVGDQVCLC